MTKPRRVDPTVTPQSVRGQFPARGVKSHNRYTDDFRASAVAAAIVAGYPSIKGALSRTAANVGIPHQLLRNWIVGQQNPPPQELLQVKKQDLRDLFMNEIYDAAGNWQGKRGTASYSQLVLAVATLYDKVRLIDNLPTEIIAVMPDLLAAAKRRNVDAVAAVRELINEMDSVEVAVGK